MAYGPRALPPSNSHHFKCKSWTDRRHRAISKNQGQGHSKGQSHLLGQGHKVLRSLNGQWHMVQGLCHQVTAIISSASHGLTVDIERLVKIKVKVTPKVKVI